MSAVYKKQNSGLLSVCVNQEIVTDGMKVKILEEGYQNEKGFWNIKVQVLDLPEESHKLAGCGAMTGDNFVNAWGENMENWIGHTAVVSVRKKRNGDNYVVLVPTDDPVDTTIQAKPLTSEEKADIKAIREAHTPKEPTEPIIDPKDIPF
jgi:hypothetical protein